MLPPAHYSVGLASGLAVYKLTGSPVAGGVAAFLSHLPLDWLADEYWDWQDNDRLNMGKLLAPAGAVAVILTLWLALDGGTWPGEWTGHGLGWWPLIWGLAGLGMDLTDTPLHWLTTRMGWWRKTRYRPGIELWPCHYYSPWYWGQAWPRMLSFYGTLAAEYLTCIPALLYIWLTMK